MPAMPRAEADRSQDTGALFRCPIGVARAQTLGPPSVAFPRQISRELYGK